MADVREIGTPAEFPPDAHHHQVVTINDLEYMYIDRDEEGREFKEGHWVLVGVQAPSGPSGPAGQAGTDGRYPTIDPKTGQWIYNWSIVDKDGDAIDKNEPSNYPAQGVLRLKGLLANEGQLPRPETCLLGDCYFISDNSTAGDLYVIPFHDERDADGNVDSSKNEWVNMGQLGLEGPKGLPGDQGERGETGKALCEVVDVLPSGSWEPGTIYMEKNTNHLFIAIEPQNNYD